MPDCTPSASLNPSGEFANTLIRGVPPDSNFTGNSWAGIREAWALGYRYIEVDARVMADGELLPGRFDALEVLTTCSGSASALPSVALNGCYYLADGSPVRTLSETLSETDFDGVYVDLKSTHTWPLATSAAVVDAMTILAAAVPRPETVLAMTYHEDGVEPLLNAGLRAGFKGYPDDTGGSLEMIEAAADMGAEMVCIHAPDLDETAYSAATTLGVWTLPWAADGDVTRTILEAAVEGGAGGVISNHPDDVQTVLNRYCD